MTGILTHHDASRGEFVKRVRQRGGLWLACTAEAAVWRTVAVSMPTTWANERT